MKIALVKEIKIHEYRVALTPDDVEVLVKNSHEIFVEHNAGYETGFSDKEYEKAGALIVFDKQELFDKAEMIIKVKEPLTQEYEFFHEGQILFTYLHIAANKELALFLLNKKISAIAYETITDEKGGLPCLTPMSEIAGRLAAQEGAKYLEKPFGGRGVLLGGVPGVERGNVVIIGAGIVGLNACKMLVGLGANVIVLDISASRLAYYDDLFASKVTTLFSNRTNILKTIKNADLVIGAVLIPGAKAPKLITKDDLKLMKKNSVIVDVAIDQGGCFETSKITYHDNPTYIVNDVVHYCVANMPGAVCLTSTLALSASTLKFTLDIANKGLKKALFDDKHLLNGLNTYNGKLTNKAVAFSLNLQYEEEVF
ncbi:MAG: alanine dehydrogenase [Poseidonibacter sp.]|uniref:alanine dehydrogenase n=1 Tax=Poseidonibacter sp. TaxID=2321188 RepID=UPI00359D52D8